MSSGQTSGRVILFRCNVDTVARRPRGEGVVIAFRPRQAPGIGWDRAPSTAGGHDWVSVTIIAAILAACAAGSAMIILTVFGVHLAS